MKRVAQTKKIKASERARIRTLLSQEQNEADRVDEQPRFLDHLDGIFDNSNKNSQMPPEDMPKFVYGYT